MKRYALPFALLLLLVATAHSREIPAWSEPAISADGSEIAFTSGGDIWTAPVGGGEARLLVSDPAMESRPFYSPDGSMLAFVSTRSGNGDWRTSCGAGVPPALGRGNERPPGRRHYTA